MPSRRSASAHTATTASKRFTGWRGVLGACAVDRTSPGTPKSATSRRSKAVHAKTLASQRRAPYRLPTESAFFTDVDRFQRVDRCGGRRYVRTNRRWSGTGHLAMSACRDTKGARNDAHTSRHPPRRTGDRDRWRRLIPSRSTRCQAVRRRAESGAWRRPRPGRRGRHARAAECRRGRSRTGAPPAYATRRPAQRRRPRWAARAHTSSSPYSNNA